MRVRADYRSKAHFYTPVGAITQMDETTVLACIDGSVLRTGQNGGGRMAGAGFEPA
jgi:hypothetical protein